MNQPIHFMLMGDKVIIHARDQSVVAVTAAVDGERFEFESEPFLRCDYNAQNSGILNSFLNLGLRGPAYNWSGYTGRFTPRVEQRQTVDFLTQNPRAFCFNGLGTGKTASSIWAAEFLRSQSLIRKVLIVCTLSTMKGVWKQELMNICPHRSAIIAGDKPKATREKIIAEGCDYTIINHDGVKTTLDALIAADYDLVILDEASVYRNDSSARSKDTRKLCENRRCWALTATPRPRSSMDAWGLGRLVNPARLPRSKVAFQNATMMQMSKFIWVERPGADEYVFNALQPAIRIRLEDCTSLPPVINYDLDVPLTPEQETARKNIIGQFIYTMKGGNGTLTINNAADVINKVLQVAQGTIKTGEDQFDPIDYKPRYNALTELIDQAEAKVIVFATYRGSCFRLKDDLTKEYGDGSVALAIGGQSGNQRDAQIERFQKDPKCRILVAHPKTAGHGLNLIEANVTVWFGITSDAELYEQACARMVRPGQTRTMILAHILGCAEEKRLLGVLQQRMETQNVIMEMVSEYLT